MLANLSLKLYLVRTITFMSKQNEKLNSKIMVKQMFWFSTLYFIIQVAKLLFLFSQILSLARSILKSSFWGKAVCSAVTWTSVFSDPAQEGQVLSGVIIAVISSHKYS